MLLVSYSGLPGWCASPSGAQLFTSGAGGHPVVTDKDSMESATEPLLHLTASALTLGKWCHLQFDTKQLGGV